MSLSMRIFCTSLLVLTLGIGTVANGQATHFHGSAPGHKVDYAERYRDATDLTESPAGQAVLADCLAAYGGMAKLKELNGFRLHYAVDNATGDATTEMVKSFRRGRFYRTTEGEDTRILNDQICWYEHGDQTAELNDTRYRAELFSYLALAMPLAAKTEHFDGVRYGKIAGDPLAYLYFEKADSLLVEVAISPDDHLIAKTTGILPQGDKNFVFSIEYGEHYAVDGYIFPRRAVFYSLGMRVGITELSAVEIGPDFADDEFLPQHGDK